MRWLLVIILILFMVFGFWQIAYTKNMAEEVQFLKNRMLAYEQLTYDGELDLSQFVTKREYISYTENMEAGLREIIRRITDLTYSIRPSY